MIVTFLDDDALLEELSNLVRGDCGNHAKKREILQ
jgi:hypothetical protein